MIQELVRFMDRGNHFPVTKGFREHPIPENGDWRNHRLRKGTRFKIDREEGFDESRGH